MPQIHLKKDVAKLLNGIILLILDLIASGLHITTLDNTRCLSTPMSLPTVFVTAIALEPWLVAITEKEYVYYQSDRRKRLDFSC